MDLKKFFKPTIGKIILFITFLLIMPLFGWQNFICEPCLSPPAECPPCGESQFKFFGIPLLLIDGISPGPLSYPKFTPSNLPVNIILIVVIAYVLSCLIIQVYKIIKK